jgi:predicted TIM-barrel fold metal-dependent hydrolase
MISATCGSRRWTKPASIQVLAHGAPSTQNLDADIAFDLARRVNDGLHDVIRSHPRRPAAFAALPTADPIPATDELGRTVMKLGFKGAMVHGLTNGQWFDDRCFWPIFERAQALEVPIYLHTPFPHPAVMDVIQRLPSNAELIA